MNSGMDLNDLYYFTAVVDHQGFTEAERATGIDKSKLSRRLSQLEERLGVRLLQRNTRGLTVTVAGQAFYSRCAAMVEEAIAAHESIERLRVEPAGTIRVSCPTVLAHYYLSTLLPGFMAVHPKVRVALEVTDRRVRVVEERIDIALRVRPSVLEEPGLIVRKLAVTKMILVASPGYADEHQGLVFPDELPTLTTISSVRDSSEGEQLWNLYGPESKIVPVSHQPALFCHDLRVQYEAVLRGIGIGLIPEAIVSSALMSRSLVRVLPEWTSSDEIIHAALSSRRGMLPSVRAFLDYLAIHLPIALRG
jgi:DNA-binding transcriptional LysR family regulator